MGNLDRFPQGKPAATASHYSTLINYKVHAGSFSISVIHQTLTWTTYLCRAYVIILMRAHTHRGWVLWQWVSTTFLTRGKTLTNLYCVPDSVWTLGLWISSVTLYQLSHPVWLHCRYFVLQNKEEVPNADWRRTLDATTLHGMCVSLGGGGFFVVVSPLVAVAARLVMLRLHGCN